MQKEDVEKIRKELRPFAETYSRLLKGETMNDTLLKIDAFVSRFLKDKWPALRTHAENIEIARKDGTKLRLVVVRNNNEPAEDATGILWCHGGGFEFGRPEMDVGIADLLCGTNQAVMVLPDYRQKQPYPAALEDCYDALLWMKEHAAELGIRENQLFVGGEGAGGGIACALTLAARDNKDVNIAFAMPLYPMLDDRRTSTNQFNEMPVWDTDKNYHAWTVYKHGVHVVPATMAPARNNDYKNLPPAFTFVGTEDPVYSEVKTYFENLYKGGSEIMFKEYKGCFHCFEVLCPGTKPAEKARELTKNVFLYARENFFADQPAEALQPEPAMKEEAPLPDNVTEEEMAASAQEAEEAASELENLLKAAENKETESAEPAAADTEETAELEDLAEAVEEAAEKEEEKTETPEAEETQASEEEISEADLAQLKKDLEDTINAAQAAENIPEETAEEKEPEVSIEEVTEQEEDPFAEVSKTEEPEETSAADTEETAELENLAEAVEEAAEQEETEAGAEETAESEEKEKMPAAESAESEEVEKAAEQEETEAPAPETENTNTPETEETQASEEEISEADLAQLKKNLEETISAAQAEENIPEEPAEEETSGSEEAESEEDPFAAVSKIEEPEETSAENTEETAELEDLATAVEEAAEKEETEESAFEEENTETPEAEETSGSEETEPDEDPFAAVSRPAESEETEEPEEEKVPEENEDGLPVFTDLGKALEEKVAEVTAEQDVSEESAEEPSEESESESAAEAEPEAEEAQKADETEISAQVSPDEAEQEETDKSVFDKLAKAIEEEDLSEETEVPEEKEEETSEAASDVLAEAVEESAAESELKVTAEEAEKSEVPEEPIEAVKENHRAEARAIVQKLQEEAEEAEEEKIASMVQDIETQHEMVDHLHEEPVIEQRPVDETQGIQFPDLMDRGTESIVVIKPDAPEELTDEEIDQLTQKIATIPAFGVTASAAEPARKQTVLDQTFTREHINELLHQREEERRSDEHKDIKVTEVKADKGVKFPDEPDMIEEKSAAPEAPVEEEKQDAFSSVQKMIEDETSSSLDEIDDLLKNLL